MKKLFLFLLTGMMSVGIYADNDIQFIVNGSDGNQKKFQLDQIENIVFVGNMMVVRTSQGEESLDINSIADMLFDTVSGIEGVYESQADGGLLVNINKGILKASHPDTPIHLRIFDMSGKMKASAEGMAELEYDLSVLDSGVYIVMVNDKAIKFIR